MIKLFTIIMMTCLVSFTLNAQTLRDLRVVPDTNIIENQRPPVTIKDIKVPIPKLGLTVNYWKHWTRFGLNMNQASFSDNWKTGGGVNSFSWTVLGYRKSEYNKGNFNFTSELDLNYGKIRNKNQLARKNRDRIFFDNKVSYKISSKWALFTSFTFESQFDVGYTYRKDADGKDTISGVQNNILAPAYMTESVGLEYKPDKTFSVRLGTGTARQTIVTDNRIPLKDNARFGVEDGKKLKNDLAFQLTANLDRNIAQNLNLYTRYNVFADYKELTDPSHRLDVRLTAKVTTLVNVTLNGSIVYDSIQDGNVQYSQALALGLVYNLPR